MIHYIKPFSTSKKIGEVYNKMCSLVPDGDFICIQDYDTMVLTTETFKVIEAAVARYPDTAIFGAMTNRIAYSHQRVTPEMDPEPNIIAHILKAQAYAMKYPDGECESAKTIAGFFMLFKKSYWEKSPFIDEIYDANGNLFDYCFCRHAQKNNLPIRVIKGVYVFHAYRLLKENYKDTSHLRVYHQDGTYT